MAFTTPFARYRCPYCSSEFHLGECAIVSKTTHTVLQPAPRGNGRIVSRFWLKSLGDPEYIQLMANRVCPVCNSPLPANSEYVDDNIVIAVVGDISSGKSHYIASLINQMREGYFQSLDKYLRFTSLDSETDGRYMRNYYESVFKNREQLPPTQVARSELREPLIYEVIIAGENPRFPTKRFNLIIYDVSGEDITRRERIVQYSRYALNSSAIIFLADPLTMPGIVDLLPHYLRPEHAALNRRPSDILNSIVQLFERYNHLAPGSSLTIPIAVTLSKSDLLKYIRYSDQQYTFLREPIYSGRVNLEDAQAVDNEVRELIAQFGERSLLQTTERFTNVSFFATSATGWPPDDRGHFPAIQPMRCLDPLLWILWRLNIIESI